MTTKPTLSLQSKKTAVLAGHSSIVTILCKLLGSDTPTDLPPRSPLNLALVLDKSGSMSGRPLEEAKKCASNIVKRLTEKDKVCVVAYDDKVELVSPLAPVSSASSVIKQISSIHCGGMTNLHGGWEMGVNQLRDSLTNDSLSRVLLLSDGNANAGISDTEEIVKRTANALDMGVSTSTYGLGEGFNEDLMVQMGNSGGGSSYYGETANDLDEPFSTEFDLLSSLCAKDIYFDFVSPKHDVKCLNTQIIRKDKGFQSGNLPYEGAVWLVFEVLVKAEDTDSETVDLGTLNVQYTDLDGATHTLSESFSLPTLSSQAYADLADNPEVVERVLELEVSQLQLKAKEAARRHDWDTVDQLLGRVTAMGANNEWLAGIAAEMRVLAEQRNQHVFMKEAMYSSRQMQKRTVSSRAYSLSNDTSLEADDSLPSFMRRKKRQGKKRD